MRLNRTSAVVGLAALGLAGGLTWGGVAMAATDDPGSWAPGRSACSGENAMMDGNRHTMMDGDRHAMVGGGRGRGMMGEKGFGMMGR